MTAMYGSLIEKIRFNSREMVREFGLLNANLTSGFIPAIAHALIELDIHGALNLFELAALLNLDKSTVTRHVQKMKSMGLVIINVGKTDQRYRSVMLSPKGKEAVQGVHEAASLQVQDALLHLAQPEKDVIARGIEMYSKALRRIRKQSLYQTREIREEDNIDLMKVIKTTLKEFGADRPGFAFTDPELENMHAAYSKKKWKYYVIERKKDHKIMGGAGIGKLAGGPANVCELKKMYLLPDARGNGISYLLLQKLMQDAVQMGYESCYLETLESMHRANKLYEAAGFTKLPIPMGKTGHDGCDAWYLLKL